MASLSASWPRCLGPFRWGVVGKCPLTAGMGRGGAGPDWPLTASLFCSCSWNEMQGCLAWEVVQIRSWKGVMLHTAYINIIRTLWSVLMPSLTSSSEYGFWTYWDLDREECTDLTNLAHVGLKWVGFGLGSNHAESSAAPATKLFFSVNSDAASASARRFLLVGWNDLKRSPSPCLCPSQGQLALLLLAIPTNVKCFLPWCHPPHSNCFTAIYGLCTRTSHGASVARGLRALPIITVNMWVNILLIFLFFPWLLQGLSLSLALTVV